MALGYECQWLGAPRIQVAKSLSPQADMARNANETPLFPIQTDQTSKVHILSIGYRHYSNRVRAHAIMAPSQDPSKVQLSIMAPASSPVKYIAGHWVDRLHHSLIVGSILHGSRLEY